MTQKASIPRDGDTLCGISEKMDKGRLRADSIITSNGRCPLLSSLRKYTHESSYGSTSPNASITNVGDNHQEATRAVSRQEPELVVSPKLSHILHDASRDSCSKETIIQLISSDVKVATTNVPGGWGFRTPPDLWVTQGANEDAYPTDSRTTGVPDT